jgi:plasmid stability protein
MVSLFMGDYPVASITVKNIPDELYIRLKEAAQAHHRSLNNEIIYCVERILCPHKIDVALHLATATKLRAKTTRHPLTDDELKSAINEGRP